jgi:hypothetical protein
MAYNLVKFETQQTATGEIYVALILKKGEDQPFRVTLEHFDTEKEAMEQVKAWITTQEEDDARGIVSMKEEREKERSDSIINKLNKNL